MVQQNYFQICIQQNFKSLSKIILFMYFKYENNVRLNKKLIIL